MEDDLLIEGIVMSEEKQIERQPIKNTAYLTESEIDCVAGGVLPAVAAAVSLASHTAVRTIGWALVQRAAIVYSVYSAASYYGGGRHRNSAISSH
jgi:hypothetical protein